jgi:hypothetical protein
MTAPTKAKPSVYVTGHCGVGRCGECRGEYAGTTCNHVCHTPDPLASMEVAASEAVVCANGDGSVPLGGAPIADQGDTPALDLDLGDALLQLHNGVEGIDLATLSTDDLNDIELCDLLGQVRQTRTRLAQVESVLEQRAAKAMTGDLLEWPGGTAERRHGKDRKDWDSEAVIRRVREAVTRPLVVDVMTGEMDRTTAALIYSALDAYADTNRPTWRVTKLKGLGINPDDHCTAIPGRTTVQVNLAHASAEAGAA